MLTPIEKNFLERAIELSRMGMTNEHGGPFGSVIVRNNEIVGEGCNMVIATNDPTAHAEIVAIRDACKRLETFQLNDCDIYTSCEPCPMCLGAIYWARPKRVIYANTRFDAAAIEFDDHFIYQLTVKSGRPESSVRALTEMIHEVRTNSAAIDDAYLYQLYTTIQQFYK